MHKIRRKKLTIGMMLETAREDLHMSIKEVSDTLKIKEKDIIALEQNTFSLVNSRLYRAGFIRSYAKLLKIDSQIIEKKIKKLEISSNIDNKKHQLVNLGKNNKYSPDKETFFNAVLILIMLSLLLFSFNYFNSPKLAVTELIINQLK